MVKLPHAELGDQGTL